MIISASIILATIVTIVTMFQVFVVPELLKERAYNHSQEVMRSLQELYTKRSSVITLSYFGIPLFAPISFDGTLRYSPKPELRIEIFNMTEDTLIERWLDTSHVVNIERLEEIYLHCQTVQSGMITNITIVRGGSKLTIHLTSEDFYTTILNRTTLAPTNYIIPMVRLRLEIIHDSTIQIYNFMTNQGESLILNLKDLIHIPSQFLTKSTLYFTTNSPKLYLKYFEQIRLDRIYTIRGAIIYRSSGYSLSYMATPWSLITFDERNSSISTSPQIFWINGTLTFTLLNMTGMKGSVGGVGNVKINLIEDDTMTITSSFSKLSLNFTHTFKIKNAHIQLIDILKTSAPRGINISIQEGGGWIAVTFEGDGNFNFKLILSNVKIALH